VDPPPREGGGSSRGGFKSSQAARAKALGAVLASTDGDFAPIDGLTWRTGRCSPTASVAAISALSKRVSKNVRRLGGMACGRYALQPWNRLARYRPGKISCVSSKMRAGEHFTVFVENRLGDGRTKRIDPFPHRQRPSRGATVRSRDREPLVVGRRFCRVPALRA